MRGWSAFFAMVDPRRDMSFDDVRGRAIAHLQLHVTAVHWFSTYRVHHRVADRFRSGRTFLLGDAAHIHSPVGGQGMNTGIGDAVNLSWKLAAVLRERAPESLLETYEPERIAFARRLVATTDRAFTLVSASGGLARLVRTRLMPGLAPRLTQFAAVRRLVFLIVSQIRIGYRHSAPSAGRAGRVRDARARASSFRVGGEDGDGRIGARRPLPGQTRWLCGLGGRRRRPQSTAKLPRAKPPDDRALD